MSLLGKITKQAREVIDFDINYSTTVTSRGTSISSQVVEVLPVGLTVFAERTDNIVKVIISGGTNNTLYKVTVLATASDSLVYEDEVNVLVENI